MVINIIGKINKTIYQCVSENVLTDEVIITDERVKHIIQRRGEVFYNRYKNKFSEIINNPDYIFANSKNTLLVCKKFEIDEKFISIVLRLVLAGDNPEYKNSIITVIGENEKRFQQRLRNHQPVYKKE